ncbi:hypothetical protein AC579_1836 [Pseudocercospora musae]|uniref:IBR domain-containing protein n=1 Tax=Pseudocercospora musae TaxID=113226 RepID=A0A139I7K9_9PEZI|nr:hypothetical protein AC579_1836 [Pseudocercospora musae]
MKDERSPVLWAGQPISINIVQHQFSSAFVEQYRHRMQEYGVKPQKCLYCSSTAHRKCESYLGERTDYVASRICSSCGEKICTHCGSGFGSRSAQITAASRRTIRRQIHLSSSSAARTGKPAQDVQRRSPADGSGHWDVTEACALCGPSRTIERRLQTIDEIELNRIVRKCQRIGGLLGQYEPLWLVDTNILSQSLLICIQSYTVREQPEHAVQQVLASRKLVEEMLRAQKLPLYATMEAKFPSLGRMLSTYRLAKEERWDDLEKELTHR